ncbi:MAG: P63C domain-containing protein [Steroidobacteraceae bacterium]
MSEPDSNPKAAGGFARAAALSPQRRKKIAEKAAAARWAGDPTPVVPKATHAGEVHIGELTIQCAVLPDGRRVLSQRGVGRALGRGYGGADWRRQSGDPGGGNLPFYVAAKSLGPYISAELLTLVTTPIAYRHGKGGGVAYGIEASALPMICDVWLKARAADALNEPQKIVAQKAEILMRGLAHVGILALVDEATGYQEVRDKKALQEILELYLRKEAAAWVKRFPDEFYRQLYRLRGWEWRGMPGGTRIGACANYTKDLIYDRIEAGLLRELENRNPSDGRGSRRYRHHQLLTDDVGIPKLAQHFGSVMTLQKVSTTWDEFYQWMQEIHPRRGETLQIPFNDDSSEPPQPSEQPPTAA